MVKRASRKSKKCLCLGSEEVLWNREDFHRDFQELEKHFSLCQQGLVGALAVL
jgi:hypothetical protein